MSESRSDRNPFDSLFEGLDKLVNLAQQLKDIEEQGGKSGQGEVDLGRYKSGMKAMYGFSINTMSSGKPFVQTFGNVRNSPEGPKVNEEREPVVDVIEEGENLVIYAEMPGVSESDIQVELSEDMLEISANTARRKYRKEVHLPIKAESGSMQTQYNNGILEVRLKKAS